MTGPTVADVLAGLDRVRDRIAAAGGDPAGVDVLAVTKGFDVTVAETALAAGLADLGESYAQDLAAKVADICVPEGAPRPRWHFVGRLQSNKVKLIADDVALWHSIDRSGLVTELARRAPGAHVLVQVNASGEPQKGGCPVGEVADLTDLAVEHGLVVEGLMTVGVLDDETATRRAFETVADLRTQLGLERLSMGMSADLELAVAAGSTMIRVGTALFGDRPRHPTRPVRD